MAIYPATNPPSGNTSPLPAWTKDTVKVTDGSERQLGKDAFLTLLLTQLQNQDPTNPMDNTEMTAQMAQFSQLEQLANINTAVETMTGYIQAQNQFQTMSMIGKDVLAENDQLSVTDGQQDVNAKIFATEACKLVIYIVDADGKQVRMLDKGMVAAGSTTDLGWDGLDSKGAKVADGAYKFQVQAKSTTGETLEDGVYPEVSGKITSVSFDSNGQPVIHMGHASLSLGQVVQILESGQLTGDKGGETGTEPGAAEGTESENS